MSRGRNYRFVFQRSDDLIQEPYLSNSRLFHKWQPIFKEATRRLRTRINCSSLGISDLTSAFIARSENINVDLITKRIQKYNTYQFSSSIRLYHTSCCILLQSWIKCKTNDHLKSEQDSVDECNKNGSELGTYGQRLDSLEGIEDGS